MDQAILGLTLICHSPFRGVSEFCSNLLDWPVSLGKVHNVLQEAVQRARSFNLSKTCPPSASVPTMRFSRVGGRCLWEPTFESTYCYLLSLEEHRDGDTPNGSAATSFR